MAVTAIPILGAVVCGMVHIVPWWIPLVQFGIAWGSLTLKHGGVLKKFLHPLGDALVHRTSRTITDDIACHAAQSTGPVPCFVMGNLCFLGVLEQLHARGFREVEIA